MVYHRVKGKTEEAVRLMVGYCGRLLASCRTQSSFFSITSNTSEVQAGWTNMKAMERLRKYRVSLRKNKYLGISVSEVNRMNIDFFGTPGICTHPSMA